MRLSLLGHRARCQHRRGILVFAASTWAYFPHTANSTPTGSPICALPSNEPRNLILVKGREGSHVGRAMNILFALDRLVDRLAGYKIVVLLATPNVRPVVAALARVHSVPFEFVEYVPYDDLMRLYARSRLAISATTVDGTPSFLTEAMAMGALPVHSDMESIREWIEPGVNGLLFPIDDLGSLERAIIRGLEDDDLCRQAAQRNEAACTDAHGSCASRPSDRRKAAEDCGRAQHRRRTRSAMTALSHLQSRRVLVVADQGDQFFSYWINSLQSQGFDVHFFPLDASWPSPDLNNLTDPSLVRRRYGPIDAPNLDAKTGSVAAALSELRVSVGAQIPYRICLSVVSYRIVRSSDIAGFGAFAQDRKHAGCSAGGLGAGHRTRQA